MPVLRSICIIGLILVLARGFSFGQEGVFVKFIKLSCPEKRWVAAHPFIAKRTLAISESARDVTKQNEGVAGLDNYSNGGKLDAFRHTYWMAALAAEIKWKKAWKLGKAHEKGNKKDFKRRRNEEGDLPDAVAVEMDLWNNEVGLKIGRENKNAAGQQLIVLAKAAVEQGKCKIIKMDKSGNSVDVYGKVLAKEEWQGKWVNLRCLVMSNQTME